MEKHRVPTGEIEIDCVKSSGAGGQNVNKRSTKVEARWHVGASAAFTDEEKQSIRREAGNRLNSKDEIVLFSEVERSQARNREDVVERLEELVARALRPRKKRKPTKPSRAVKERRLEEKRRQSQKKASRRGDEW